MQIDRNLKSSISFCWILSFCWALESSWSRRWNSFG